MNIFVIEDEPPILREIIAIIESFHEDYQIIGKAANGQDALNFLKEHGESVDVMITDIQVPVVNGLELIYYNHEHLPHILNIILTGFSDFNYAQTAIRYGVFNYLLKPIDEEEFRKQLQKAYAQKCLDYLHQRPDELSMTSSPSDSGYQIALLSVGSLPMYASQYNELFIELWKQIELPSVFEQFPSLKEHYWIIDGATMAEKIILFMAPDSSSKENVKSLSDILTPLVHDRPTITIAIDTRPQGIRNIHQSVLNLRNFINRSVHLEESRILFYSDAQNSSSVQTDYRKFHPYHIRLSNLFSQKNIPVFEAEFKNYFKSVRELNFPTAVLYRIIQDLFHTCIQAADDCLDSDVLDIPAFVIDTLTLSDSYQALFENMRSIFLSLFETMLREETVLTDKANIMLKVDSYIKENYTLPINTKSVAAHFGFTPAYLSKIFREYKQITPADYIIRLRIEKAKELFIADPHCKIKDVAAFVGYEDSLYFSKAFKKATNMSPKQFLEKHSP